MDDRRTSQYDTWASGAADDPYVGRWSRLVAREFLGWLNVPAEGRWLDVGCGTGALSGTILDLARPASVTGIDRSPDYVAFAREQFRDERAHFEVGDAASVTGRNRKLRCGRLGPGAQFHPGAGPRRGRDRPVRREPAGTVAAYVWDYAGGMQLLRHFWDAAAALDPSAADLDEGPRFPLCQPEPLKKLFQEAGLERVEARPLDIATVFRDFDDYWTPFLGGQGPAPGYARSLSDERQAALRERIRAGLPFAPDGSIPLMARAWAVRGSRP